MPRLRTLSLLAPLLAATRGFAPPTTNARSPARTAAGSPTRARQQRRRGRSRGPRAKKSTELGFLGTDGGILGVGAPELATVLVVGYFILGPSELYKLTKEIGKFVQNFRTLGAEATKSFESTMENQLELTELRKAQAELSDAFSFRRSINTDETGEAFDGGSSGGEGAVAAGGAAAAAGEESGEGTKKRRRRLVRRKKKAAVEQPGEEERDPSEEYPDLDMLDEPSPAPTDDDDAESLRARRLERLGGKAEPDWFAASEEEIASRVLDRPQQPANPALDAFEKSRFQSQLSAEEWNAQIMANEDKLSPLAMVMKRLAILEEEKQAADRRLEEEYQRRMDNEDKYYLEKRRVLEESIEEIQEGLYGGGAKMEGANNGPKFS